MAAAVPVNGYSGQAEQRRIAVDRGEEGIRTPALILHPRET